MLRCSLNPHPQRIRSQWHRGPKANGQVHQVLPQFWWQRLFPSQFGQLCHFWRWRRSAATPARTKDLGKPQRDLDVMKLAHRHFKKSWISRIGFCLRHLFLLADLYHLNCTSGGGVGTGGSNDVPCMFWSCQLGEISPSTIGRPNHRNASSRQSACNVRLPQSTAIRTATTL